MTKHDLVNIEYISCIVRQYYNPMCNEPIEDVIQDALLCACKCAERYDPSSGATFNTYVYPRIYGLVMNKYASYNGHSYKMKALEAAYAEAGDIDALEEASDTKFRETTKRKLQSGTVNAKPETIYIESLVTSYGDHAYDMLGSYETENANIDSLDLAHIINTATPEETALMRALLHTDFNIAATATLMNLSQMQVRWRMKKLPNLANR